MENPPFEDVFPIQDGDFPLLCLFTGGYPPPKEKGEKSPLDQQFIRTFGFFSGWTLLGWKRTWPPPGSQKIVTEKTEALKAVGWSLGCRWFHIFFMFTCIWGKCGNSTNWSFSDGLKPPTSLIRNKHFRKMEQINICMYIMYWLHVHMFLHLGNSTTGLKKG